MTLHDRPALDANTVRRLLNPPKINPFSEEQRHPWSPGNSVPGAINPFSSTMLGVEPLLRVWDKYSGSQPEDNKTMSSRAAHQPLDTAEARKGSLSIHLDHGRWEATPYISFTRSHTALEALANSRSRRGRDPQTLTVIDPEVRIRSRLPLLDVSYEMQYYGIEDPYENSNLYYKDHFVCLWQVTTEEVVGSWK